MNLFHHNNLIYLSWYWSSDFMHRLVFCQAQLTCGPNYLALVTKAVCYVILPALQCKFTFTDNPSLHTYILSFYRSSICNLSPPPLRLLSASSRLFSASYFASCPINTSTIWPHRVIILRRAMKARLYTLTVMSCMASEASNLSELGCWVSRQVPRACASFETNKTMLVCN